MLETRTARRQPQAVITGQPFAQVLMHAHPALKVPEPLTRALSSKAPDARTRDATRAHDAFSRIRQQREQIGLRHRRGCQACSLPSGQ
jgi:hypothetical protein